MPRGCDHPDLVPCPLCKGGTFRFYGRPWGVDLRHWCSGCEEFPLKDYVILHARDREHARAKWNRYAPGRKDPWGDRTERNILGPLGDFLAGGD